MNLNQVLNYDRGSLTVKDLYVGGIISGQTIEKLNSKVRMLEEAHERALEKHKIQIAELEEKMTMLWNAPGMPGYVMAQESWNRNMPEAAGSESTDSQDSSNG